MADGTTKPVIFISYSHKDEPDRPGPDEVAWLTFVQSFLAPVVKVGIFDIWVDEHLHGSDSLDPEIKKKLAACDILVLLASRFSLASTYVVETEIGTMRQRQQNGEDVRLYSIILSPIPHVALAQLKDLLLRPKDGRPLSLMAKNDRDVAMAGIADDIAAVAEEIAARKKQAAAPAAASDIRVNRELELDIAGNIPLGTELADTDVGAGEAPTAADATLVDIAHLPETGYERLVGREPELARLDEAWAGVNTNIISLIAEGGAGKSALVNEWLKRLQFDNYRGAEAVLGWSFYSQGSKERATAADEFLNWALEKLGIKSEATSAGTKGEAIAEALMRRRVLLVLDGVEPLQHSLDTQLGQLKDEGLRALLRRFASAPQGQRHGLIVLTSRLAVKEIARWQKDVAPVVDVEKLSDEAGAALLRDNGVWGTDKELRTAAHDFGGHPLALGMLASFIKETQTGDVRRRDHIRAFFADPENPRHDHAKRVMESYEKEWFTGHPVLLAIMHTVGLFDRPASNDCLNALRAKPAIKGLTDKIVGLDDSEWQRAVTRLREVRLLLPRDPTAPDAIDAHPLVREWFGERLRTTNESAWKAAHGRLYEHLRDTTKEGKTPTLEDLAPLYQAIAHGCRAGRHEEALERIYVDRICRRWPDGDIEFYVSQKLGAFGSDLAAISWFFDNPYAKPVAALKYSAWLLAQAALRLRALGRFAEAIAAVRASLDTYEKQQHWAAAAVSASNLSQAELLAGEVAAAIETAKKSVTFADRSRDEFQMLARRANYADVLHAAGEREAAALAFADAEQRQKKWQPKYRLLSSQGGYQYCDLLLAEGKLTAVRDRASQTLRVAKQGNWLLDIALHTLILGRAHLGLALAPASAQHMPRTGRIHARTAHGRIDQAVDGLRAAGQSTDVPHGLLARAASRRSVGEWVGAARDLDEVDEIAEQGPMKLHLCDLALQRVRLAFAQIEAFAPLNGTLKKENPPKPVVPGADEIAKLKSEAEKQLKVAADCIETCGYHRRDEELAELQAVLRGERKFADLPPRV